MARHNYPGMIQRRGSAWRVALCVAGKTTMFGARTEPTLKYGTRNDVIEWTWRKYDAAPCAL